MEKASFDLLLESVEEMKQHMEGKVDLKKTTYEIIEVPEISPERVRAIRKHMGMTQEIFGKFMGVKRRSVESWEGGQTHPAGPARRMMSMLEDDRLQAEMTEKFLVKC